MSKRTILILTANPYGSAKLRLDKEVRDIDEGLRKSEYRDQFNLESVMATRIPDMQDALLRYKPSIVHFCGHGHGEEGLVFEDNNGNQQLVPTAGFANMFKQLTEHIECVVLNACYSEVQAKSIAEHIPFVIGMNKAIGDKAALIFSSGFYRGLGGGMSIKSAFDWGCNSIELHNKKQNISEHKTPVLINKKQAQASRSVELDEAQEEANPQAQTSPPTSYNDWICYEVTYNNGIISFISEDEEKQTVQLGELPRLNDQSKWLLLSKTLFLSFSLALLLSKKKTTRLRIMTDDSQLALLPWHCLPHPETKALLLEQDWLIEVSPVHRRYHAGFHNISPVTPLLIIPTSNEYNILADSHYAKVENQLSSQLNINGHIQRLSTAKSVRRELSLHKPDLIYIYACLENESIMLDEDTDGNNSVSLDQLGCWIEEAEISPLVIISLVGGEGVSNYPIQLIKNTNFLWLLTTSRTGKKADLEKQLFSVVEQLAQNGDISALIKQNNVQQYRGMQNIVWNNRQPPYLVLSNTAQQRQQQFRAALLTVILGREDLKRIISGDVYRHLDKSTMLAYAMTGVDSACPFDVPAQVQQRLQYDNVERSLQIVPFYLRLDIDSSQFIEDSIDKAISQNILKGNSDAYEIFQAELERRNLQQQECCITLNWYLTIPDEQEDIITERLKLWVEAWSDLVCEYFSSAVPDKAILIHALCLKVTTQKMSELVQKKVNRILRNSRDNQPCNKQYLFLKSPLGVLDADEINDFFYENNFWRENLQLDQQNINLSDFSDWVCDKTKGEFEQTTTLIWQQYQQNYSRYKEDNHE